MKEAMEWIDEATQLLRDMRSGAEPKYRQRIDALLKPVDAKVSVWGRGNQGGHADRRRGRGGE